MDGKLLITTMIIFLSTCHATHSEKECKEISEAVSDYYTEDAINISSEYNHDMMSDYKISMEDCGQIRWYYFEVMKGRYKGRHWLIKYDTRTGKGEFSPGM